AVGVSSGTGVGAGGPHSAARLVRTARQPGWSGSPLQPPSAAHWMRLNGNGGEVPSTEVWISLRALRARSASARTHSDAAAARDQMTTAAFALSIFSPISWL